MFDAGYLQASDREDTGIASGTRDNQPMQEPRANARRLINSVAGTIHQPERVSVGFLCATGYASAGKSMLQSF